MATPDTHIADLATEVLDVVVARFALRGVVLPEHRYITIGAVAYDCEQLVVSLTSLAHALPGDAPGILRCSAPRNVSLSVHIVRCVPTPEGVGDRARLPSADVLNAAGRAGAIDAWLLARELPAAYKADEFAATCDSLLLSGQEAVGPEGGFVGVRQDLVVQL